MRWEGEKEGWEREVGRGVGERKKDYGKKKREVEERERERDRGTEVVERVYGDKANTDQVGSEIWMEHNT